MDDLIHFFKQVYNVQWVVSNVGYAGLAAIIFAETGLLVGFFLPGDSLLFTAGLACVPDNALLGGARFDLLTLNVLLSLAAIVGDTVGYWIGYRAGIALYQREKTLFFRKDHLLHTKEFYEKYGARTIVYARFVPLVRTFAPVVAGIAQMPYRRFLAYNIFGGIGWVASMTILGYYLGRLDWIRKNLEVTIMLVIFVSLIPAIIAVARAWMAKRDVPPTETKEGPVL